MVNFDDFKNEIEARMDILFQLGTDISSKFSGVPLQTLESDCNFITTLGIMRLQLWSPQAAAMLASPEVGIETTADPLRVVLGYISTDEAFLDKMIEKAGEMAPLLSELARTAAE